MNDKKSHSPQRIRESLLFHLGISSSEDMPYTMADLNLEFLQKNQNQTPNLQTQNSKPNTQSQNQNKNLEPQAFFETQKQSEQNDNSTGTSLDDLHKALQNCTRCKLSKTRKNIVLFDGNPNANIMFIGEAPGADEDEQGMPFVGRAGQLLTKMITAMGLKRESVFIANVIKCRPPQNRNPEPIEVQTCFPFLKQQIALVNPKIIITLGKFASQTVLNSQVAISKMRGRWQNYSLQPSIKVMPTFHPSYLLRNPEMKKPAWQDLKMVMAEIKNQGL